MVATKRGSLAGNSSDRGRGNRGGRGSSRGGNKCNKKVKTEYLSIDEAEPEVAATTKKPSAERKNSKKIYQSDEETEPEVAATTKKPSAKRKNSKKVYQSDDEFKPEAAATTKKPSTKRKISKKIYQSDKEAEPEVAETSKKPSIKTKDPLQKPFLPPLDPPQTPKKADTHKPDQDTHGSTSKRQKTVVEDDTDGHMVAGPPPTPASASKASPTSKKTPRKGAARQRTNELIESPGVMTNPRSFIGGFESSEQKNAAYLGYNNIKQVRILAMTWPVLKALKTLLPIAMDLNKNMAFILIKDEEKQLATCNPNERWPFSDLDNKKDTSSKRSYHLACLLLQMEADIKYMSKSTPQENAALHSQHVSNFSELFSIPTSFTYEPQNEHSVKYPELGPRQGETRLEAINRVWSLLRYLRYCIQSKVMPVRFSNEGVLAETHINLAHVPTWMRPNENAPPTLRPIRKPGAVTDADELPKIQVDLSWKQGNFKGKEELDEALEEAEANDITIPSAKQLLLVDPRLFTFGSELRDNIRRQYRCQEIKMNIRQLHLFFDSPLGIQRKNVFTDPWDSTKSTFQDITNSNFTLEVTFEKMDDPDISVYESFAPMPEISGFFNTSSGNDVTLNTLGVQEMASIAFGEEETPQSGGPIDNEGYGESSDQRVSAILTALFYSGASADDIGAAPNPKKRFPDPDDRMKYYGFDVNDSEQILKFQVDLLQSLTEGGKATRVTLDKLPKSFTSDEKKAIEESMNRGQHLSMAKEKDPDAPEVVDNDDEQDYFTMQTAFSGTDARVGPCEDICLTLLDCEVMPNGRVWSRLLSKQTDCTFFVYQITGAIGCVLKMCGSIDGKVLLESFEQTDNPRAKDICEAASQLEDLLIHGAILADEVGLGKTKQSLLVCLLMMYIGDRPRGEEGNIKWQPSLLIVPPTLVNQWLAEIRDHWPCFDIKVSYSDHEYKEAMSLDELSGSVMKQYPNVDLLRPELRYIFDQQSQRAAFVLIISSYETHKARTGEKKMEIIPGKKFKRKFEPDGVTPLQKSKPRKKVYWVSAHTGVYYLIICDEAQKVKNFSTGVWSVIYVQNVMKVLLATATPVHNTIKDMIALLALLFSMIQIQLASHLKAHPEDSKWLHSAHIDSKVDLIEAVSELPRTDPRRLAVFSYTQVVKALVSHISIATKFNVIMDMVLIQRSTSSILPSKNGQPVSLRSLFKKIKRKTAEAPRKPGEEAEYQLWHRYYAMQYVNELKLGGTKFKPSKPRRIGDEGTFISGGKWLRKLGIANCSTKLARLDAIMEEAKGDTFVKTINTWRERGLEADFIQDLTRGPGQPKAQTCRDLIGYLTEGSPVARCIFQDILAGKVLQKLDEKRLQHHQKLIIGEAIPVNAYFLQLLLREALIDARVLHAGLSNNGKTKLANLFNDPESSLKVLIIMQDVGGQGLNLHHACDRVLITSPLRSMAVEKQVAGRPHRVTSKFPVHVTRKITPNSHDQFLSSRQKDKATVALAANAADPAIRKLVVKLLNRLQPQVDAAHASKKGIEIQRLIDEREKIELERLAAYVAKKKTERADEKLAEETVKEAKVLPENAILPEGSKRLRKAVIRFNDADYHPTHGYLLPPEAQKQSGICDECYCEVEPTEGGPCEACDAFRHFRCHLIKGPNKFGKIICNTCPAADKEDDETYEDEDHSTDAPIKDELDDRSESTSDQYYPLESYADYVSEEEEVDEHEPDTAVMYEDGEDSDDDNDGMDYAAGSVFEEDSDQSDNDIDDIIQAPGREIRDQLQEAKDTKQFLKTARLEEFISDKQPDDAQRHLMALLTLPTNKTWTEEDLKSEQYLKIGLHLLYNAVQGKEDIHFKKSIHIKYLSFPQDVQLRIAEDTTIRKEQVTAAGVRAG